MAFDKPVTVTVHLMVGDGCETPLHEIAMDIRNDLTVSGWQIVGVQAEAGAVADG